MNQHVYLQGPGKEMTTGGSETWKGGLEMNGFRKKKFREMQEDLIKRRLLNFLIC